jgi:transcriptional regulator with XRE-family HTH domain
MSVKLLASLGATIKKHREASGVSQENFARQIGMDRAYFGRIERGSQNISIVTASRIAEALEINVSDLFDKES